VEPISVRKLGSELFFVVLNESIEVLCPVTVVHHLIYLAIAVGINVESLEVFDVLVRVIDIEGLAKANLSLLCSLFKEGLLLGLDLVF
jgi:hypothetical protein